MCRNLNAIKFLAFGVALVTATSVTYADEDRDSARSGKSLIIDATVPYGLTGEKRLLWEKIWRDAEEYSSYIERGDFFFRKGRYQEALQEYMRAAETSKISSDLLLPKERIAIALEALGNFAEALSTVEFLIQEGLNEKVRGVDRSWKQALEAAHEGRYDIALLFYRNRLATAEDWEKKSKFLEQRLRLMEERARAAGQLQSEGD
jgi:tetratricopeptide (TPR) repeat protein